jgi:hypothetical protein
MVETLASIYSNDPSLGCIEMSESRAILAALAAVYADHADYDQSGAVA